MTNRTNWICTAIALAAGTLCSTGIASARDGDWLAGPGRVVTGSIDSDGYRTVATINIAGEPIVFEQGVPWRSGGRGDLDHRSNSGDTPLGEATRTPPPGVGGYGEWTVRRIPGIAEPAPDAGLCAWTGPADGATHAALATADGLLLYTRSADRLEWNIRSLTDETPGAEPIFSLMSLTSRGFMESVIIAGLTTDDELVLYRQTQDSQWSFRNLSTEDFQRQGIQTPLFQGEMDWYHTVWGADNLCGVDAAGDMHVAWIAPGLDDWRLSHVSDLFGLPPLQQGAATASSASGRLALTALSSDGSVIAAAWTPEWNEWRVTDLSGSLGGPRLARGSLACIPSSTSGDITALGLDDRGNIIAYSWLSGSEVWAWTDLSSSIGLEPMQGRLWAAFHDQTQSVEVLATALNGAVISIFGPEGDLAVENLSTKAHPLP